MYEAIIDLFDKGGMIAAHAKEFKATYNAANRRHLRLGAAGECVFSRLPYFR